MDVFSLRDTVVDDYATYVRSFVRIRDEGLRRFVAWYLEYHGGEDTTGAARDSHG